ncbi:MAG: 5-(carboxyamino)imidazole ribonucleotide mutase [Candidatus Diapherotrites archaeon]|uniref:N5-carboxyaminoimidazole ribonucleotide mutase n=1 Tax=Candidatus Iainarchaeum sp. TaxID=3101447 RepID=A0A8T3YLW8_9ARCH|nr:5-(carboxyamino)imidazole ribonucleotide mutase [Candidatus Diapherotrites archaeon]
MGSKSDLDVMKEASEALEGFGVACEMRVISAHRSPKLLDEYLSSARGRGISVIIAGAGGAAHLAGVVASHTTLPVIGVPVESKSLKGLDSLLSTIQMPPGVPVATVGINAAKNAGILAVHMLALSDASLAKKLDAYRADMAEKIRATKI